MVKLHPFPSYQHLNLHLACLFSYLLLCLFSSHGNSSSTYGMKLKLISALALDKRPTLIPSATLPPDSCKFARPECNISNVNKIWKMATSSTYREDLLVKVSCEYNLYISRYSLLIILQQILVCKLWKSLNMNTLLTHA